MPYQFREEIPVKARMLWASVLRRAVFDYVLYKGVRAKRLDWQRAFQYIFTKGIRYENGLSFEEVCSLFDWDPGYLRRLSLQLTRSDIKRLETSSFKDDFNEDLVATIVRKSGKWKTSNFALPFYPRMVDEFVHMAPTKVVRKETLARKVPLVQWQVTA